MKADVSWQNLGILCFVFPAQTLPLQAVDVVAVNNNS